MTLRQEIEKDILSLYDTLDPSGKNTERMRALLKSFKTDREFYQFFEKFYEDKDQNFSVSYEPYNNPVTVEFVEKAAKKRGVPIYERIYMPYLDDSDPDNPPGSVHPVMVLVYPLKRLKQMIFKKNHSATTATKRNPETGQVTGADKTARETDTETFSLIVQNQYNSAREFYGPRADDMAAKYEMMRLIQQNGEVSLSELPNDPMDKVTMNTLNYYMLGACLTTNFIEDSGYLLPITLEARENKDTTIKR